MQRLVDPHVSSAHTTACRRDQQAALQRRELVLVRIDHPAFEKRPQQIAMLADQAAPSCRTARPASSTYRPSSAAARHGYSCSPHDRPNRRPRPTARAAAQFPTPAPTAPASGKSNRSSLNSRISVRIHSSSRTDGHRQFLKSPPGLAAHIGQPGRLIVRSQKGVERLLRRNLSKQPR